MWTTIAMFGNLLITLFTWNRAKRLKKKKNWIATISKHAGRPILSAKAHDDYKDQVENFDAPSDSNS